MHRTGQCALSVMRAWASPRLKGNMTLRIINRICYTIAIVCIISGVVYALALIWGDHWRKDAWKGLATLSVVFLGAVMTLSVNQIMLRNNRSGDA